MDERETQQIQLIRIIREMMRETVRRSGSFRVEEKDGIGWRHCAIVQRADGYDYDNKKGEARFPPLPLKRRGFHRANFYDHARSTTTTPHQTRTPGATTARTAGKAS